jgi:hypothetical protein
VADWCTPWQSLLADQNSGFIVLGKTAFDQRGPGHRVTGTPSRFILFFQKDSIQESARDPLGRRTPATDTFTGWRYVRVVSPWLRSPA